MAEAINMGRRTSLEAAGEIWTFQKRKQKGIARVAENIKKERALKNKDHQEGLAVPKKERENIKDIHFERCEL